MPDSLSRFAALGAALAERGLDVQLPLTAMAFDGWAAAAQRPLLRSLWPEARGGLLVGSGGTVFFERFRRTQDQRGSDAEGEHPLDGFTRREIEACCVGTLGAQAFATKFPFVNEEAPLPFQALARLAGAPAPGPLGITVLREWGPWWAFRALILLPFEVPYRAARLDLCATCSAPCVEACPAGAVSKTGFAPIACADHRTMKEDCADRCLARRSCPVAPHHAYSPAQATFHMQALTKVWLAASAAAGRP